MEALKLEKQNMAKKFQASTKEAKGKERQCPSALPPPVIMIRIDWFYLF